MLVDALLRWMHILAAMTAVGGMIFMRLALIPSVGVLDQGQRDALHAAVRGRWSKLVMLAIGLLLVSGITNFVLITQQVDLSGTHYHALFGVKFLLAMAIFGLSSVLAGRSAMAVKLHRRAPFWLNVNLTMAVVLVCISGLLKLTPHEPKPNAPPPAAVRTESDVTAAGLLDSPS